MLRHTLPRATSSFSRSRNVIPISTSSSKGITSSSHGVTYQRHQRLNNNHATLFNQRQHFFHTRRNGIVSSCLSSSSLPKPSSTASHGHLSRRNLSQSPGSWVSPDAVPKGEHLKKFSRNLTKEAQDGKLDPVSSSCLLCCQP